MTNPIKYDPALHVIVPREPTMEMFMAGYRLREESENTGPTVFLYESMIAAAPPITVAPAYHVTKAEAVELFSASELAVITKQKYDLLESEVTLKMTAKQFAKLRRLLEAAASGVPQRDDDVISTQQQE